MSDRTAESYQKIGLGTVQFGLDYGISNLTGRTSMQEAGEILAMAFAHGIDLLDTALNYGRSEEVLGTVMHDLDFKIVSKFPAPQAHTSLAAYLQESLSRLRVKQLYGYLAHNADVLIEHPAVWRELQNLKIEGWTTKIGYSLYTPRQLEKLMTLGFIPDLIQVPYNIFDRRFEEWFPRLKDLGVEIHTRSVFLQGLFFIPADKLGVHFRTVKPTLFRLQSAYPNTADLAGALLDFCRKNPQVDKVVVGVNTSQQFAANLQSLQAVGNNPIAEHFDIDDESILLPYNWPEK